MVNEELKYRILQNFGFAPTADQLHAVEVFARFMTDRDERAVMILRGSAGTGKTSLAGAIVRTMQELRQKVTLLAPTGRAAKVFSLNATSLQQRFIALSIGKKHLQDLMGSLI